jgi:hypothetical protein
LVKARLREFGLPRRFIFPVREETARLLLFGK